jgi:hypothetical protein
LGKKNFKKKIKICLKYFFLKLEKEMNFKKKCSKFWVLKIARKTYTSILVLLFRSDQDRVVLVVTNFEYSFKNITFCHCCVWKKQLYLSKISINIHKTGSYNKEATLWDLNSQILNILSRILHFVHFVTVVWKKQLYLSKISINTHKTGSYNEEATLWDLNSQILNIHSRILHFVTVVFGRNSFTSQRSPSTHIKMVHTIKKPLYGV